MAESLVPPGGVEVARVEVVMYVREDGTEALAVSGQEYGHVELVPWKQLGMLAQAMTMTGAGTCRAVTEETA